MTEQLVPSIMVSTSGRPKSGKTHFAMTFPEPIKVFSFDLGAQLVRAKFSSKQIDVVEYPMPIIDSLSSDTPWAEPLWQDVKREIYEAIDSCLYKTIVIDPLSVVWDICRFSFAEEQNRSKLGKARDYGEPNARMRGFFLRAATAGVNLVAISYLKDEYKEDKQTGNLILDGWKHSIGMADVHLTIERRGRSNVAIIQDSRFGFETIGYEMVNPTYDDLAILLGL
uniref:Putative ATPase domain containing protein n=1 Tax=viral metagenome TaxID=1070528 RepID=A0A6M3JMT8_9ZZZZ